MFYLLIATVLVCKFSVCGVTTYQEYTANPAACTTIQTRIVRVAHRYGYINPQIISCETRVVFRS